jgi:hypothetical protein
MGEVRSRSRATTFWMYGELAVAFAASRIRLSVFAVFYSTKSTRAKCGIIPRSCPKLRSLRIASLPSSP